MTAFGKALSGAGRAIRGLLRLAGRPARRAHGDRGIVVQPYRGYGSRTEVFVIGRVFRQPPAPRGVLTVGRMLHDIGRRIARRAVADAPLTARFHGCEQQVRTDADGYFRVHIRTPEPVPDGREWYEVHLTLDEPDRVEATARVFIPPEQSRFVVISDIDDTVMVTGVANVFGMMWRLFVQGANSRTAFPGVTAFYRALHDGVGGEEKNPMLYVSRAPWGIYDVLDEFFRRHSIPVGPILFLREWGMRWTSPLPRKAVDHKRHLIDHMLEVYRHLPVVLIGDSGQHDPEVYRRIVAEHGDRVLAVYIRNVSKGAGRAEEIAAMAEEAEAHGSSLLLAADSIAMAEHAARLGLIQHARVPVVRGEKVLEEGDGTEHPVRRADRRTIESAIEQGEGGEPDSVVVEPRRPR